MSRIDLTPAHTVTVPLARASAGRSAETSSEASPPRCTPPSPPVANTRTPALLARWSVAATVVAPSPPRAATSASSRVEHLAAPPPGRARRSSAASSRPIVGRPPSTAIVAGTAPREATAASIERAACALSGHGRPWLMIVDSSATIGAPARTASRTAAERAIMGLGGPETVGIFCHHNGHLARFLLFASRDTRRVRADTGRRRRPGRRRRELVRADLLRVRHRLRDGRPLFERGRRADGSRSGARVVRRRAGPRRGG